MKENFIYFRSLGEKLGKVKFIISIYIHVLISKNLLEAALIETGYDALMLHEVEYHHLCLEHLDYTALLQVVELQTIMTLIFGLFICY